MVAPGDPELAADLARRAASVGHDGEAIYGAQVLAAMESQAFVESDIDTLIDTGLSFIPGDSVIYRMIGDVREWHAGEKDWRVARERLAAHYGYDKYGGNCHVVPNHGLIVLSLLYGDDDFQKTLMIANTCGWDTDCNSGNVGCLMGIKNGLAGIDAGTGLLMQGTREWADYRVTADVTPHMVKAAGIAARVQGLRRYYALLLCNDGADGHSKARLVKALDGDTVLAETDSSWAFDETHGLSIEVAGTHVRAWIDGEPLFDVDDADCPLTAGGIALVCAEGRTATHAVTVRPAG